MGKTTLINSTNLNLTMALWLATDTYDHIPVGAPKDGLPILSVTQLLKPTKALILGHRLPDKDNEIEIIKLTKSRIGQAIHSAIEAAFENPNKDVILKSIGFPSGVVDKLVLNPTKKMLEDRPDCIPIYIEQRAYRKVKTSAGTTMWISGKFDQVINGQPEDNKSTGVYSYMKMDQTEKGDYALQMACYKWLNEDIITSNMGIINFILTDWLQRDVGRDNYPPNPVMEMPVNLYQPADAEKFIIAKLDEIEQNAGFASESDMIRCTDEELWRSEDVHKYYANPDKLARATKNFDNYAEALNHKTKAGKGIVITSPGEVKRCNYCDAAPLCTQRLEYI